MKRRRSPNPAAGYWLHRKSDRNAICSGTMKSRYQPSPFTLFDDSKRFGSASFERIVQQVACGGIGRSEAGELYYLLRVGRRSRSVIQAVPAAEIAARSVAFFEWLAKAGAPLLTTDSKNKLLTGLEKRSGEQPSFHVVTRPGWNAGWDGFVHPSGLVGASDSPLAFQPPEKRAQHYKKFSARGRASDWCNGPGALHCGNSLGITLAAAALASPLLLPMVEENFAVCVVGKPASGKSSWLVAASSQWGAHPNAQRAKHRGSAEIANHTLNNLEELFAAHSDIGLTLDDLRSLSRAGSMVNTVEHLAFALSDGEERGRLTTVRELDQFRVVLLTSANASLQAMALGGRKVIDRGALDRLIEIPLPVEHSAVEEMHGCRTLQEFCERLRSRSVLYAGTTGLRFVRKLHAWMAGDRDSCVRYLMEKKQSFENRNAGSGASERVLRRFGIIYAAGCLAIRFRLHPWSKHDLLEALAISLDGHIRLTATAAPGSPAASATQTTDLLVHLKDWFVRNRIQMRDVTADPIHQVSATADTAPAYLYEHAKHGYEVLVRDQAFTRLVSPVCNPADAKRLLLAVGAISGDAARTSVKRTIGRKSDGTPLRPTVIALQRSAIDSS